MKGRGEKEVEGEDEKGYYYGGVPGSKKKLHNLKFMRTKSNGKSRLRGNGSGNDKKNLICLKLITKEKSVLEIWQCLTKVLLKQKKVIGCVHIEGHKNKKII